MSNFTVDISGKETELVVKQPTARIVQEANKQKTKMWTKLVNEGELLKDEITQLLIKRGLWSEQKENQARTLELKIVNNISKLEAGGIKLSEAREVAVNILRLRKELNELLSHRSQFDEFSIESQLDNIHLNYLMENSVYYTNGKPLFTSVEDYLNKSNEEYALKSAEEFVKLLFDVDELGKTPEVKFLQKYNFMNEDGVLLDERGNKVDLDGNPLSNKEAKPFLDEDGKELVEETKE